MILPTLEVEQSLWKKGFRNIVGIDEVGRGSWAGPLVAAGVILPQNFKIPTGFADSKQLTAPARQSFDKFIRKIAVSTSIVEISSAKINQIGLSLATQITFRKILKNLGGLADFTIVDAFHIKYLTQSKQRAIKGGDQKCASIAAASIIAKVYRDSLMEKMSTLYPNYHFEKHKGYGTKVHQAAIQQFGFCEIHRTGYNLDFLFT